MVSTQEALSEGELGEQTPGIHILTVGYDSSQLTPIIDVLSSAKETSV